MLPWGHPSPHPKRHMDRLSCFCTAHDVVILYNGSPLSPQNCPFPWRDVDPSLINGSSGPTRVHMPNDTSISSAISAGLTIVTDRPTDIHTDRQAYHADSSVTIGRIYVRSTAMQPNEKEEKNTLRQWNNRRNQALVAFAIKNFISFVIRL